MLLGVISQMRQLFGRSQSQLQATFQNPKGFTFTTDQIIHGVNGSQYKAIKPICEAHTGIWEAQKLQDASKTVVLKSCHPEQFKNEVNALKKIQGHKSFRQLIDVVKDQHILVLEYLNDSLHTVVRNRPQRRLERLEAKLISKIILEGLIALHKLNIAHTDVKPDNIMVNYSGNGIDHVDFKTSRICDLGCAVQVKPDVKYMIGAAPYRGPESNLRLPLTLAGDIWSFGATLLYFLVAAHVFSPPKLDINDSTYMRRVLYLQFAYFGPHPHKFAEIMTASAIDEVDAVSHDIETSGERKKFQRTLNYYLSKEDLEFLRSFMKIDPRDRPSAKELLNSSWFDEVR